MVYIYNNYRQCNPHPENKRVRDCVKRAITIASQINYHDIAIMLNRFKKITKAKDFNSDSNWKRFVVEVLGGFDRGNMQYANQGHRYQVCEYAEEMTKSGHYIGQVAGHLVAMHFGCYFDTWDCGEKSLYKVWRIPPYKNVVERIRTKYPKLCKGLTLERYLVRT